MPKNSLVEQYRKVDAHANVEDASSYKLIQMLLVGALEKISFAISCIEQKDIAGKGENISFAITIIDALQSSLDKEQGGEVAENLHNLYQYMMEKLLVANLQNDSEILKEVVNLLITIKSGWDGIEDEANEILAGKKAKSS